MKQLTPLLLLLSSALLHADELTKSAQSELKDLGFFYGEVSGVNGPETVAAIKRYQIRNGLEVTGSLTKETLQALGLADDGKPAPAPQTARPTPPMNPPTKDNPIHLRRDATIEESDRNFLRQESGRPRSPEDPSAVDPPAPLTPPSEPGTEDYAQLFARTPYANAPGEVQASTLRKAQALLSRNGYYREEIDGLPGPATEEGILAYQRRKRLPLSGRLDLATLDSLALLPGRTYGAPMKPFTVPRGSRSSSKILRGVWIE